MRRVKLSKKAAFDKRAASPSLGHQTQEKIRPPSIRGRLAAAFGMGRRWGNLAGSQLSKTPIAASVPEAC
jgi:hypothetical protein